MHILQRRIDGHSRTVWEWTQQKSFRVNTMYAASTRIFLGSVAGALSILMFHQTTLEAFFWLGLAPNAAFRIAQVPPFHAPLVVSITFWGAVYGALFAAAAPLVKAPRWVKGIGAGLCAMTLAWFVFLPVMGHPMAFAWKAWPMLRSFIAYQMWGLGLIIVLPLLRPRQFGRSQPSWSRQSLAA